MKKFFVLIAISGSAMQQWMETVDEATRKEQSDKLMGEWQVWMTAHDTSILDKGLPLGKTKRITAEGITDTKNDLNWYLIVEAESHEAAAEMFKDHPQLKLPTAYIEVMGTAGMGA